MVCLWTTCCNINLGNTSDSNHYLGGCRRCLFIHPIGKYEAKVNVTRAAADRANKYQPVRSISTSSAPSARLLSVSLSDKPIIAQLAVSWPRWTVASELGFGPGTVSKAQSGLKPQRIRSCHLASLHVDHIARPRILGQNGFQQLEGPGVQPDLVRHQGWCPQGPKW